MPTLPPNLLPSQLHQQSALPLHLHPRPTLTPLSHPNHLHIVQPDHRPMSTHTLFLDFLPADSHSLTSSPKEEEGGCEEGDACEYADGEAGYRACGEGVGGGRRGSVFRRRGDRGLCLGRRCACCRRLTSYRYRNRYRCRCRHRCLRRNYRRRRRVRPQLSPHLGAEFLREVQRGGLFGGGTRALHAFEDGGDLRGAHAGGVEEGTGAVGGGYAGLLLGGGDVSLWCDGRCRGSEGKRGREGDGRTAQGGKPWRSLGRARGVVEGRKGRRRRVIVRKKGILVVDGGVDVDGVKTSEKGRDGARE